jgi:elongation factor Tu
MLEVLDLPAPGDDAVDGPFLMPIEDVFSIPGRGTVVTGRIERGIVRVGEEVAIVGTRDTVTTTAASLEKFRELPDEARAGDTVSVVLPVFERENVERGQVLAKPGSIESHAEFDARVYVLTESDVAAFPEQKDLSGGNALKKKPDPLFYFRTADVKGAVELPGNAESLAPGEPADIRVRLAAPMAMETGTRFRIRVSNWTIGVGVVTAITD